MNPTIKEFLLQIAWLATMSQNGPVSGMPRTWEKVRLAPFEPVAAAGQHGGGGGGARGARLTRLIPSLNRGGNRVQDNREVERLWVSPFMCHLIAQDTTVLVAEFG
jgi:hypothetical protein